MFHTHGHSHTHLEFFPKRPAFAKASAGRHLRDRYHHMLPMLHCTVIHFLVVHFYIAFHQFFIPHSLGDEGYSALRTTTWFILLHFRMHWTGVNLSSWIFIHIFMILNYVVSFTELLDFAFF